MYADSFELSSLKAQVGRGELTRRIFDQLAVLAQKVRLDDPPDELFQNAASFLGTEKALKKRGVKKSEAIQALISHLASSFFRIEDRVFSHLEQGTEYLDAFIRERISAYAYMYASDSPDVTGEHILNQILAAIHDVRDIAGGIGAGLIQGFLDSESSTMDFFLDKGTNHDYRLDVLGRMLPELRTLTRFSNEEIHLLRHKVRAVLDALLRQSSDSPPTIEDLIAGDAEPVRLKRKSKSGKVSFKIERLNESKTHRGERVTVSGLQVSAKTDEKQLFFPLWISFDEKEQISALSASIAGSVWVEDERGIRGVSKRAFSQQDDSYDLAAVEEGFVEAVIVRYIRRCPRVATAVQQFVQYATRVLPEDERTAIEPVLNQRLKPRDPNAQSSQINVSQVFFE